MSESVAIPEPPARWGRGRYLFTWALLALAQGLTVQSALVVQAGGGGVAETSVYGVGLVLLQAMKLVPTLGRLRDLGRPPDDALWTFVPVMNIALWTWMTWRTPSEARWNARRAVWIDRLQALPAWGHALRGVPRAPGVLAGSVALLVVGDALSAEALRQLVALDAAGRADLAPIAAGGAGLCGVYLISLLPKRGTIRPAAWLGGWLVVPLGLLYAALSAPITGDAAGTGGMLVFTGLVLALTMAVSAPMWGLATARWIAALDRADGRSVPSGVVWAVIAASVGRSVVVTLGMQVILPGVWFAVSWALAEVAAARNPAVGPFRASAAAVSTRRGPVLKILLVWGLLSMAASVVTLPLVGPAVWQASMLGTTVLPFWAGLTQSLVTAPVGLLCVAAMRAVADDAGLGDGATDAPVAEAVTS